MDIDIPHELELSSPANDQEQDFIETGFDPRLTLRVLQADWKAGIGCDVVVYGKGRQMGIPCQKNVLQAVSGYFRSFFMRWTEEKPGVPLAAYLDEIKIEIFQELLDIIFTGRMRVEATMTFDLMKAAAYLEMDAVRDCLCNLLHDRNDLPSHVWLYANREAHANKELYERSKQELLKLFGQALDFYPDTLLDFSKNNWIELLSNERLFVIDENKLFNAISTWVAHTSLEDAYNPHENRPSAFQEIFSVLRMGCLDKLVLSSNLEKRPVIVKEYIQDLLETSDEELRQIYPNAFNSRTVEVLVYSSANRIPGSTQFHLENPLQALPGKCTFDLEISAGYYNWSVVSPDNLIFFGCEPSLCWDPATEKTGRRNFRLINHSGCHGLVYLNGCLYVLQNAFANNGKEFICIDAVSGAQREIPPMPGIDAIFPFSIAMVAHKSQVYVFWDTMYCVFHAETNSWSNSESLPCYSSRRSACVGPDGLIYLIGLREGSRQARAKDMTKTIGLDKLDPTDGKVTTGKSVIGPWSCLPHIVCVNNQVMLVGGRQDQKSNVAELYNITNDEWVLGSRFFSLPTGLLSPKPISVARCLSSLLNQNQLPIN